MPRALKRLLRWLAYHGGPLPLYHRLRNRRALTVVLFHRVLSPADARWPSALPDWTVSDGFFDACLRFFRRHYRVVSLEQVVASVKEGRPLPPRSLLVTFDDGYADNAEYALPLLRAHGVPAVVFVFSDAVDSTRRPWTEDLLAAHRGGRVTDAQVARLFEALAAPGPERLETPATTRATLGEIAARWPALDGEVLRAALASAGVSLDRPADPPQMMTAEQVRELLAGGVAIGAHGKSHTALTRAADLGAELREPRTVLANVLGTATEAIDTLAFPYGMHDAQVVTAARAAGYEVLFSLVHETVPLLDGRVTARTLGRVNVSEPELAPAGPVDPVTLALHFFRLPHGRSTS